MAYVADPQRYDTMTYRRTGRSGLLLPGISLGLWQNFGDTRPIGTQRAILRRAFDLGVTHFDLANNYGPPYGAAELNFSKIFGEDFTPYRDELIISSKAGFDMWPGPYGNWGSRKYVLASLDQSLARMGLDYVDIFYHHRPDPLTPIEETAGALATAVNSGRALYVGISSYNPEQTTAMADALAVHNIPLLIHQPSYNMFNRWVEDGLLDILDKRGIGGIAFVPLSQGLLTDRYLSGDVPTDSRAALNGSLQSARITPEYLERARALNEIAKGRGQTLAQMALLWILRKPEITSALIGASSVAQLEENVGALSSPPLTEDEIAAIEPYATELP
jgi:L-glyceraldehyde 3-phosphate reductase